MPIHVNSIDSFVFQDLVGTIYVSQQQVEILAREGVNGLGFRLRGRIGQPFTLKAVAYYDDWDDYASEFVSYTALTAAGLVIVTRNDIAIAGYKVLEVTEATPPQAVVNVAGSPGSQVRGETLWKLVHA